MKVFRNVHIRESSLDPNHNCLPLDLILFSA